jgi:filamin
VVGPTKSSHNDDPSTVGVSGQGIERGVTGEPSTFVIDTSGVGAGTLSITVDGPSKVDLSCNEVDEGYEVRYTPLVPGKYFVTVKYNGKNVKGSPFSVTVGGDNLAGGNTSLRNLQSKEESRTSSMTMETMQRTSYIRHQVIQIVNWSNISMAQRLSQSS